MMDGENPTAGDGGASITDRLERMLSAESEPAQEAQPQQVETPQAEATDEPDEGVQQQDEPLQLTTSDLSKVLGLDESILNVGEDGTITVKTKIDGQEGVAKLKDLLADHQKRGHSDKLMREAAELKKQAEARQAEIDQQAQARMQQVEQLANVAAQELMREYQSIDWNTLRQTDPGQYAALRADFAERNQKLSTVFQQAQMERAKQTQAMQAKHAEVLQQQAQRLPELIPEWKDQATQAREVGEIREWAVKQGFEPQEVDNFTLAHHVAVMRKAMLYDKLQAKKPAIEQKVREAPKIVKPGGANISSQEQTLRNLKTQVRASGGKRGIAEYLLATGKV